MKKQYNEEERSKIWKVVMVSSTTVILLVLFYLFTKLFTGNPLEGKWMFSEGDMELKIKGSQKGVVRLYGLEDPMDIKVDCSVNKEEKTIQIQANEKGIEKLVKAGYEEGELRSQLAPISNTFYYSLEENQLVLTEREYGEQIVLTKE